jgi:polar amino acid transport system substrate-binding protein
MLSILLAVTAHAGAVVKVSGHPDWPPFSWRVGNKIVGVCPELTEIVFKDLGMAVQSEPSGNWMRVQATAEEGGIDVVAGIYITNERQSYLQYAAIPLTDDVNVIWVAKGRSFPFDKWEDLVGKRGTAMLGESYGEKFDQFIKEKLVVDRVSSPDLNLKKIVAGRTDYYPFSLYGGQIQAKQLGFDGAVEDLPNPISKEGVYLAISKKSLLIPLLPEVEDGIRKRIGDGTVARLLQKYIALAAQTAPPAQ